MKPVLQKEPYNYINGDCFSACLASILEKDLNDIPNFHHCSDFWMGLKEWLDENNLEGYHYRVNDDFSLETVILSEKDEYCIVIAPVDVCDKLKRPVVHAVVGKIKDVGVEIVHDPVDGKIRNFITLPNCPPIVTLFRNRIK